MTIKELSKYFYLNKEIDKIKEELKELEYIKISCKNMSQIPHGNIISNPTESNVIKIIKLKDLLVKKMNNQLDENYKIEKFMDDIDDYEIKVIVRMRFKELQEWSKIGSILHCDRSTAYYKLKRYLELINQKEVGN